jgi:hypothetical protein
MYLEKVISRKATLVFLLASRRSMTKIAGSGSVSISQRHGSADPDPYQNVIDPQPCEKQKINLFFFTFLTFWQLVREAAWAAIEGNVCMETITVPKTSLHADVQTAVEKELGLGMYLVRYGIILFSIELVLTIKNLTGIGAQFSKEDKTT